MDLTTPIDIQAVIGAVKEHRDLLTTLDAEQAYETLQHFTAIPGVKDSVTLGRTTLGKSPINTQESSSDRKLTAKSSPGR